MAFSTTVSQKQRIRRKAPRGFLKRVFKRQKPHLRLETSGDLLLLNRAVQEQSGAVLSVLFKVPNQLFVVLFDCVPPGPVPVHLNCLLFLHRLAEESRTNACENKSGIIKKDHVLAAAKVILKKSRG